jgi:hypothetical protein
MSASTGILQETWNAMTLMLMAMRKRCPIMMEAGSTALVQRIVF